MELVFHTPSGASTYLKVVTASTCSGDVSFATINDHAASTPTIHYLQLLVFFHVDSGITSHTGLFNMFAIVTFHLINA